MTSAAGCVKFEFTNAVTRLMRVRQSRNGQLIVREIQRAIVERDNGNAGSGRADAQRIHRAKLAGVSGAATADSKVMPPGAAERVNVPFWAAAGFARQ